MKTAVLLVTFGCALGICMGQISQKTQEKCGKEISEEGKAFMPDLMAAAATGDKAKMEKLKPKICNLLRTAMKCALREEHDTRPSDADLTAMNDTIKKQMETMAGNNKFDCNVDIKKVADEVYNSAGLAHPLSFLAVAMTALVALFMTRSL